MLQGPENGEICFPGFFYIQMMSELRTFPAQKAVNGQKRSQRPTDIHEWKNCWVSGESLRIYAQFVF